MSVRAAWPDGPAAPLPPGGRAWERTLALIAADGVRLRAGLWAPGGPRGLAILLTGRTEFMEKAALPAADLVRRGFAVACLDWRGQGLSDRLAANPLKGHVGAFTDYHLDLDALLAAPEVAGLGAPVLVLAHSMGGAILLGALLRGRIATPPRIVLSAPMVGLPLGGAAGLVARAVIGAANALAPSDAWLPVGDQDAVYGFSPFADNLLTHDRDVWAWFGTALATEPRLQLAQPTIGWTQAAFREMAYIGEAARPLGPALALLGSGEAVVDRDAVQRVTAAMGAELQIVQGARHEILIEADEFRRQGWAAIDRFLG